MIPFCVPNLSGNEAAYLAECVTTTFVSSVGKFVTRFEELVARSAGSAGAVATMSGTTALHAALLAVGVRPGDLVVCPALTFIASANAISHCHATPWLFEVSKESWTLDPDLLKQEFAHATKKRGSDLIHNETGRRVSAIVPVFTLGIAADMDAIASVAADAGIPVVVDGAAALGTVYKGRPSGALGATLTMYSFNGNKTVTAGGGGAVAGDDLELLRAFRHLTTTARVGDDYDHDIVGYNYRMTNLQAAVGCAQIEQLEAFIAAKRRIAARYNAAFAGIRGVRGFPDPAWGKNSAWFSGLYFVGADGAVHSASLRTALRAADIDARPFWKPMHLQAPYREAPRTRLEFTAALWDCIVTLPCSTNLTEVDQDKVISEIIQWSRQQGLLDNETTMHREKQVIGM